MTISFKTLKKTGTTPTNAVAFLQRPADVTMYAEGDCVSEVTTNNHFEFLGCTLAPELSGTIETLICAINANKSTKPDLELWLFDDDITEVADNSAFAPTDTEIRTLIGVIDLSPVFWDVGLSGADAGGNIVQVVSNINLPFRRREILGTELVNNTGLNSAKNIGHFENTFNWTAETSILDTINGELVITNSGAGNGEARDTITTVANREYILEYALNYDSIAGQVKIGTGVGGSTLYGSGDITSGGRVSTTFKASGTTTHVSLVTATAIASEATDWKFISIREEPSNKIYGQLVVRNAYTPISSEEFTLDLLISQD